MKTKAHFAIIRYVPDYVRGEYVNIGIALMAPSYFKVKLINDTERLRALNAEEDNSALDYLSLHFHDLEQQIGSDIARRRPTDESSLDIFESLFRDLTGQYKFFVQMSDLKIAEIDEYSEEKAGALQQNLFERLVLSPAVGHPPSIGKQRVKRFRTEVKESFRSLKILSDEKAIPTEGRITEAYPIAIKDKKDWFWTDFGYRNGHDVLIDAIDFDSKDLREGVHRAAVTSIKFDLVKQQLDKSRKKIECLSIIKLKKGKESDFGRHLFLLTTYSDQVFNLSVDEENEAFFKKIKKDLKSFLL